MTSVDIKGLSIKDGETPQATATNPTSPNLTSFTPPPPGFDTPAATATTTTSSTSAAATAANNNIKIAKDQEAYRKSPSFNNLAMALGTGLAECMDNSTSDNNNNPTTTNSSSNTTTTATAAAVAASNNNSNGLDSMDNYARQSRHAVTRLIGHSQFQQQQREGRGSVPPNYNLNGAASSSSAGLGVGNNVGGAAGMPQLNLQYLGGDTTAGGGGNVAQQQQQQVQQQQVRFTAAMMAQQSHINQGNSSGSGGPLQDLNIQQQQQQLQLMGGQAATNQFLTNNNGGGSGSNSNNDHHLLQMHHHHHRQPPQPSSSAADGTNLPSSSAYNPLTKQQALQFQRSHQHPHPSQNVMMTATTSYQGVTVVEPNSARNSPAILNPNGSRSSSDPNNTPTADLLKTALAGGGGGGVTLQQQHHSATTNNNNTMAMAVVGGRASAPPSNLTTGTGRTPSVLHPTHTAVHHMGHHPNLRAYTANSLQRRVAELHQELGGGGVVVGSGVGSGNNGVGVVGGPTPPPSRPPTAEPPQQPQPQQVRHIIVTSATPPLHPNTAQRVVLSPNPPPTSPSPKHVLLPAGGGGGGGAVVSNTTTSTNSRPTTPATAVVVSPEQRERELVAAKELEPFLKRRDGGGTLDNSTRGSNSSSGNNNNSNNTSSSSSSRGLAILYASTLNIPDVRSTCEAFGALESFRSDFADSKGVVFATFYDLRSAQMAVVELPKALNKMTLSAVASAAAGGGGAWRAVEVEYCVPLNASSATDESMLLLSNLPGSVDEQDLSRMLSSFGEVRAIHYQANMMSGGNDDEEEDDLASYMVEFFDVQDARQALMELEQTNSWGERAGVKVATRSPAKRKQGKELILLMSNWRQGVPMKQPGEVSNAPSSRTPSPPAPVVKQSPPPSTAATADTTQTGGHVHHNMPAAGTAAAHSYYQYAPPHQGEIQQQYAAQLVMGPDGHYQYMLVNHGGHYAHPGQMVIDPHQQQQLMYAAVDPQYMHMNPQQYHHVQYANSIPGANYAMPLGHDIQQQQQQQQPPTQFIAMPSNSVGGDVNSSSLSSGCQSPGRGKATRTHSGKSTASISSGSGGSSGNNSGGNADENNDLALFIDNVKSGKDVRSSLMVRNIPNKYTQQMLLGEFAAAGHGPDKMDFFYLPIDFKNKCNRGYAFVNFVDYKDIVPFYDEYNGTGWKRFNSDKICDITYARIQGKTAMLKRFENSALMAKDDEYRPMVFVSHGERKGERECFG